MKHMVSLGKMMGEVMGRLILVEVGLRVVTSGGIGGVMGHSPSWPLLEVNAQYDPQQESTFETDTTVTSYTLSR